MEILEIRIQLILYGHISVYCRSRLLRRSVQVSSEGQQYGKFPCLEDELAFFAVSLINFTFQTLKLVIL